MRAVCFLVLQLICCVSLAAPKLDEQPAGDSEWGYRPAAGAVSATTPPSFSWRPRRKIASWEIECGRGDGFDAIEYRAGGITFNVHCPPRTFPSGSYTWRYRGVDEKGGKTNWSQPRKFSIASDATEMPLPERKELLARVPKSHPRLFVRPEDVPRLREMAKGPLKDRYQELVARCDKLLAHPPNTTEPLKYPPGTVSHSEEWREIWWGNRVHTTKALDGAATLAFTRMLGGKEEYGRLAKRILLACAKWDPKGATGYRYNDEAGMPYNYYFSRTYTFLHDELSEEERAECRRVMKIRGEEMYGHLYPRHLWRPFSSHSNRAWHFLGEIGIAFHGEIEGADDWTWFATNVFFNTYPVWCGDDGGWHEGTCYWASYVGRFTWWADVMRTALGIDAYRKPYFSQAGYYPMYLMPPGKLGGGFGDLTARRTARRNVPLVSQLAAQSGNGYWQWYVEQMGGPSRGSGYVGFVRGMLPKVEPKAPDALPTSRLFGGIGQAFLNTTLDDAKQDVQVLFKSSPFGTYSHGYDANNSFLLWAYGQRLLIRSGYRDIYGSKHHRDWMWSTRSGNCITVDGHGQMPRRSLAAKGRIVAFQTTPSIDVVAGEAGKPYRTDSDSGEKGRLLDRFTRTIIFVKPELVIVYDRLAARQKSTYTYWLHAVNQFTVNDQRDIRLKVKDVGCDISILAPEGLKFSQTDQYDPNPRPRITLREWHLTATTPSKTKTTEFVALYRPHRLDKQTERKAQLKRIDGGYLLSAELGDGRIVALLPNDDSATLRADGLTTTGKILVQRRRADGSVESTVTVEPRED